MTDPTPIHQDETAIAEARQRLAKEGSASMIFLDVFEVIVVLQPVIIVLAALQMLYVRKLPPSNLRRVSVGKTKEMVTYFLSTLQEGRFGYPTGVFRIADQKSRRFARSGGNPSEETVTAKEVVYWHSNLWDLVVFVWRVFAAFGRLVGFVAGIMIAFFCIYLIPLFVGELAAKLLLRSRIRAHITYADGGSEVVFDTRGPCAHLLRARLRLAFADPVLPQRISRAGGGPATEASAA